MRGLSLVLPNHNGAKVIGKSIEEYNALFAPKFKNFEMIAVCNGCTDKSVDICESLSHDFPLKAIEIPQRGKGYALIRGFNEAKLDFIGFLDADNPFDLKKVSEMTDFLGKYDVVIGSKYTKGNARIQDSMVRRLISLGGGTFSKFMFNLKFSDTQAGAKFLKKSVWEKINKNFICTGFDFDIEFLYKASKNNFKILEHYLPLSRFEEFSTVRLKYLPGMISRLLKLRFK